MLIDSFAPNPDAAEVHSVEIAAPREDVYRALRTVNLGESVVVKCLLGLRVLPRLLTRRGRATKPLQPLTLETVLQGGFGLLAEDPGHEMVIGVAGRFWRPVDNISPFNEASFRGPVRPGFARAIWNFSVRNEGDERTILSTETRIVCGDGASRRKFRAYWLLVRPFSGLIRILMLRAVRNAATTTVTRLNG